MNRFECSRLPCFTLHNSQVEMMSLFKLRQGAHRRRPTLYADIDHFKSVMADFDHTATRSFITMVADSLLNIIIDTCGTGFIIYLIAKSKNAFLICCDGFSRRKLFNAKMKFKKPFRLCTIFVTNSQVIGRSEN